MRLIYRFIEVVEIAAKTYSPNILCKYLYDLTSAFNTFYNKHSILGQSPDTVPSDKDNNLTMQQSNNVIMFRLALTAATAQVLKNGLYLLGIETLEQM